MTPPPTRSTSTRSAYLNNRPRQSSYSPWRQRLEHMTFAWFTSSMSLGGLANLLMARILPSTALYYLGVALFILNMLYLSLLCLLQTLRFTLTRATLSYTLSHPIEACFIPTALLAFATVINGVASVVTNSISGGVGTAWEFVLRTAFWVYFALSLVISLVCYTSLFSRAEQNLHHMNPGWVLPIFPLMLCGSIAAAVVQTQSEAAAVAMAVCGLACQGLGFTLSCMMYSILLLRLMTVGLPPPRARPGIFMCCGPPAFTILCLLGLSTNLQLLLPSQLYEPFYAFALGSSILLWLISAWFYLLTVASLLHALFDRELRGEMEFILAWWAAVFPITGWASATMLLGSEVSSEALKGLARGMVVWLMVCFVAIAFCMVRAVWRGDMMKEGKDEDRVIDTMMHRYQIVDEEAAAHSHSHEREVKGEEQLQPPTYPSTPAVSVYHLDEVSESPRCKGGGGSVRISG